MYTRFCPCQANRSQLHHGASPADAIRRRSATAIHLLPRLASSLRRFPRIQPAISTAVRFRIVVTIGRRRADVEIGSRPFFTVRHPFGKAIVPDRFWSFAERSVEPAPPTNPNAILSAIATALIRLVVMLSSSPWCDTRRVSSHLLASPHLTGVSLAGASLTRAQTPQGQSGAPGRIRKQMATDRYESPSEAALPVGPIHEPSSPPDMGRQCFGGTALL